MRHKDGKVWRYCLVDQDCVAKKQKFEKRSDMLRHPRAKHGLQDVVVPLLPMGRPISKESDHREASIRSQKQSEGRFSKVDLKIKNAQKAFLKCKREEAEFKWEVGEKNEPKEEWVAQYVNRKLKQWETNTASQKRLIEERIAEGYNKSRRKTRTKEDLREEDGLESKAAPCEQPESLHEEAGTSNTHIARQKLQTYSRRHAKQGNHVDMVVDLHCQSPPPPSSEHFAKSLNDGETLHMRSSRFSLTADLKASLKNDSIDVEASTNTMNIVSLWMEDISLANVIERVWFVDSLWLSFFSRKKLQDKAMENFLGTPDLPRFVFTFFPVVDRSHWTLLVLYNPRLLRLPNLPIKRPVILYMDSMGARSSCNYTKQLHGAFAHFAKFCKDPLLKSELQSPADSCQYLPVEIPHQPNGYDCGFYCMACMWFLIEGGLGRGSPSRTWLSKKWFEHADVVELKARLFEWVHDAVGTIPIMSPGR